jgi:hypothetical protein
MGDKDEAPYDPLNDDYDEEMPDDAAARDAAARAAIAAREAATVAAQLAFPKFNIKTVPTVPAFGGLVNTQALSPPPPSYGALSKHKGST